MAVDELDPNTSDDNLPPEEVEANTAAGEFCIPRQKLESFLLRKGQFISEQDVLAFAARIETHPAIVVGQIQHKREKYGWLRKYQTGIRKYLLEWEFVDGWGKQCPSGL